MRKRLRADQSGFGMIELLMAMVLLNIGILAIVASFNAGIFTLNRASRITTAAVLADQQMELFRAIEYESIRLASATIPATAPYTTDPAYNATQITAPTCGAGPSYPNECTADARGDRSRREALPDQHLHRRDDTGQRPARQAGDDRRPRRRGPGTRLCQAGLQLRPVHGLRDESEEADSERVWRRTPTARSTRRESSSAGTSMPRIATLPVSSCACAGCWRRTSSSCPRAASRASPPSSRRSSRSRSRSSRASSRR